MVQGCQESVFFLDVDLLSPKNAKFLCPSSCIFLLSVLGQWSFLFFYLFKDRPAGHPLNSMMVAGEPHPREIAIMVSPRPQRPPSHLCRPCRGFRCKGTGTPSTAVAVPGRAPG
eukprot:EG_transcript_28139